MKAIKMRRETGDGKWRSRVEDESLVEATKTALKRPFIMLVREPAVQLFVAYLTGESALPYVPLSPVPCFYVLLGITFLHYRRYRKLVADAGAGKQRRGIWQGKVEPEERLVPRMSPPSPSSLTKTRH